jgi:hypothetical protein
METNDAFNQRHPFNFQIEGVFGFKEYINGLIKRNHLDLAINHIQIIREKYDLAIVLNQIPINSGKYQHVGRYWEEQALLAKNGESYLDGSQEKVIYELNELKRKILEIKKVSENVSSKNVENNGENNRPQKDENGDSIGDNPNPIVDESSIVIIKNNFNGAPIEEVRNHFIKLTVLTNNLKQNWMSSDDFELFLKRSFMGMVLPKPKINLGTRGKYAVVNLFYQFYQKSQSEDWNKSSSKDKFIDLLKNAFDTLKFDDMTNDNFKNKSKFDWK